MIKTIMKTINHYINERLVLNKDTKLNSDIGFKEFVKLISDLDTRYENPITINNKNNIPNIDDLEGKCILYKENNHIKKFIYCNKLVVDYDGTNFFMHSIVINNQINNSIQITLCYLNKNLESYLNKNLVITTNDSHKKVNYFYIKKLHIQEFLDNFKEFINSLKLDEDSDEDFDKFNKNILKYIQYERYN